MATILQRKGAMDAREPGPVRLPLHFDGFFRREYPKVVGVTYALVGSKWAAEDIAQEAFLRAHRDWQQVGRYEHPDAWVRRVAVNLTTSRFRRMAAEVRALTRWVGRQPPPIGDLEPEDEEFWEAVRSLPHRQAQVIALHYVEDRSVADIAHVLGIAEGSVKASLAKGRAALARELEAGS